MSESTSDAKVENKYELPKPVFPTMDMPEPPDVPHKNATHVSCEGDVAMDIPLSQSPVAPPKEGQIRILIGVPVLSYTHEFVQSFLKFWTEICTAPEGTLTAGYYFVHRKPVHIAEIEIVKVAQFNKCTHILWLDDDVYDVTLDDLMKLVKADKDVIGGVMHASQFPHAMCVFRRYDTSKKVIDMPADNSMYRLYEIPCLCPRCGQGLSHWDIKWCPFCGEPQDQLIQKADLIPFAFTLMKASVFDRIKKPWFHCTDGYPTDSWFADRCIEAGIQEYAHMAVRLNHRGVTDKTKPYLVNMKLEENRAKGQGVVYLTSEEMDKHQYLLYTKMQEAEQKLRPRIEMVTRASGGDNVSNQSNREQGIQGEKSAA